jgi:hypothetical protein
MMTRPFVTLFLIGVSVLFLAGFMIHIFERYSHPGMTIYDGPWLIAIAQLTVGYGDFTPKTDMGRLMAIGPGIMGLSTLALVVSCAFGQLELTRVEQRMAESLYRKWQTRTQLAELAASLIQRWWRVARARKHHLPSRLLQIRLFVSTLRIFKAKSAVILTGTTPDFEPQLRIFKRNTRKSFKKTIKKLNGLQGSNFTAGTFATCKFDLVSRLLTCKRAYIRLTNMSACRRNHRTFTAFRRTQNLVSRTIISKRHSDLALRRLKERRASVKLAQLPLFSQASSTVIVDEQPLSRDNSDHQSGELSKS